MTDSFEAEIRELKENHDAARNRLRTLNQVNRVLTVVIVFVMIAFLTVLYGKVTSMYAPENFQEPLEREVRNFLPALEPQLRTLWNETAPVYGEMALKKFEEVMPAVRELPCARVINVAGESAEDFEALVRTFDGVDGVDAIEMNVSCPNVSGGLDYGADATLLEDVVARCRKVTDRPLWVKLTPNVTDLVALARAGERAGADALSLVNTYRGMAVDWRTRRATLGSETGTGGLSGPAIKPMALLAVHEAAGAVQIPLVGIGGIMTADDVLEFMVTGAVAVQVGTANFRDPAASVRIAADLRGRVHEAGVKRIGDLVGTLRALGNRCG